MVEPAQQWRNPKSVLLKKKKAQRTDVLADQENSSPMTGENGIPIGSQVFGSPLGSLKRRLPATLNEPTQTAKRARGLVDITNSPRQEHSLQLNTNGVADLPTDWSLKTKVRFTSQASFNWVSSMRTQDEAAGVAAYVKGTDIETDNGIQASFQKSLMVWMHPNLPFIQLYPRMESKQTGPSWVGFAQSKEIVDSLRAQWCNSFRSVYQLMRAGHCPYFYVCTNSFTALFLSMATSKDNKVIAYLTPTTSGLRQALTKEGIEFSFSVASDCNCDQQQQPVANGDSDDTLEDESAANSWLNSMGLLTNMAPAKDPKTIIVQQSRKNRIDGQVESVVKVEGPHVQGLFNYLLNCKTLVSTTGTYAGVPPTLLASTAFDGATLQSLKYKHGTVQDHSGSQAVQLQCLDVSGPILPHNVQALCALLQKSQGRKFKANASCMESSTAFNHHTSDPNLCTCREIICHDGLYHWS